MNLKTCFTTATLGCALAAAAQTASVSVDLNHPSHAVAPSLWGIFFEDINMSADGGIYPEMVRNRSFEDADTPEHWTFSLPDGGTGRATIVTAGAAGDNGAPPLNWLNRKSLRLQVDGRFALENEGYWGMNLAAGGHYTLRLAIRNESYHGSLLAELVGANQNVLGHGQLSGFGRDWKYHTLDFTASGSDSHASLRLTGSGHGVLCLDMVSLLPEKTWRQHGLRVDLAEALQALHPAFMRFPGGNWIEGDDPEHMYHWKDTIGAVDARTPLWNTWGYNTTQGMGFFEYLQLCEDLGAAPVFDINCGMTLGNKSIPASRMGPWIEDALDALEYANGPTNSLWGSLRAQAGHPAPFHLNCLEIGNENGGPAYWQRWKLLANAIHAKYPQVRLIMTTSLNGYAYPPDPKPDIVDEHYYESPESFMRRADQYDHYDRSGPKIFVGEYAVTEGCGLGNLRAAIGEAAFMTGLERNSDVVTMASYAPLLVNLNHRAWNPDLINFNSHAWYGLPGYYVQQMFAQNRGSACLPVTVESPLAQPPISTGRIGVGAWNTAAEFKDVQVTDPAGRILFRSDFQHDTAGWKFLGDGGQWTVRNGALRESAEKEFIRAVAGDKSWTDYTLTLKARKISGSEGFLVLFHVLGDEDRLWWNIGGWQNTADAIESGGTLDSKPAQIATGRWYDLRLEVSGPRVPCFLNGQLVHDVDYESSAPVKAIYASATRDAATGDVILKVVNANPTPLATRFAFDGASQLDGSGLATILTSASGMDENTVDDPLKVSPRTETVTFDPSAFTRRLSGNSLTVLRFHTR